jgi:hypothetical protein
VLRDRRGICCRSLGQIRLVLLQSCVQTTGIFSSDGTGGENHRFLLFRDLG